MPPCQKSSGTEPLKRSAYAASHATATATRSKPNAAIESHEGLIRIVTVTLSEDELPPTAVDLPANQGQNNVPRPEQGPLTRERHAKCYERNATAAQHEQVIRHSHADVAFSQSHQTLIIMLAM